MKNEVKCSNCGGEHHAKSQKCFHYEYYTYIRLLQTRSAMSYSEAKLEAKLKGYRDPNIKNTYSSAVRNGNKNNLNDNPNQLQKISNEIQRKSNDIILNETEIRTKNRYAPLGEDDQTQEEPLSKSIDESTIDFEDFMDESTTSSPKHINNSKKRSMKTRQSLTCKKKNENIDDILNELTQEEVNKGENSNEKNKKEINKEDNKNTNNSSDDEGLRHSEIQASIQATAGSYMQENTPSQDTEENGDMDFFDPTQKNEEKITNKKSSKDGKTKETKKSANQTLKKDTKDSNDNLHNDKCGCHKCFQHILSNMDNPTPGKLYEEMNKFVQNREEPKIHHSPANMCKCTTHLKIKMKETTWLNNIAKELKNKKEQKSKEKMQIKLNPQNRNPKMKFN